jgi:hypothetical protein
VNDCRGRGRMIHSRVAALVVAAAHVTIARHLLTAFHFSGSHRRIWQARKERRKRPQASKCQYEDAATVHKIIVRYLPEHDKATKRFGHLCLRLHSVLDAQLVASYAFVSINSLTLLHGAKNRLFSFNDLHTLLLFARG